MIGGPEMTSNKPDHYGQKSVQIKTFNNNNSSTQGGISRAIIQREVPL